MNSTEMRLERLIAEMRIRQRVCVFIDNSNLFWALRNAYGSDKRLDYIKLRDFLSQGRSADLRFYYSIASSVPSNVDLYRQYEKARKFYDGLADLGYTLVELPLRERIVRGEDGVSRVVPKEKGLDCDIVYDMASLSHRGHFQKFILVAGDEDYARTVARIRSETGMEVDVAFFEDAGCSSYLIKDCSAFINLGRADIFKEDVVYRRAQ